MLASSSQPQESGTDTPTLILADSAVGDCGYEAVTAVGAAARPFVGAVPQIGLRELERHAADCHFLMQLAKARYRGSKSLADAGEAARWSMLKEQAQASILALRRAEAAQRSLDDGVGYFAAEGERARAEMERRSA